MAVVIAEFTGTCSDCDNPYQPGDRIAPGRRGGWSHARCAGTNDEYDAPGTRQMTNDRPARKRRRRKTVRWR